MGNRVPFSGQNLQLGQISIHHCDIEESLRSYFSSSSIHYPIRFAGYMANEVQDELWLRLAENGQSSTLTILSSLEAMFRVDYLQRCYLKKKDALSRAFRLIHKRQGSRVGLEDEILSAWRDNTTVSPSLIGDIRGAFKYRHWLAHGRYWVPKLGQKFDYDSVYLLVEEVCNTFPFEGVS
ncbi:hypothetical protein [Rhodocyclus purpureus]|uniref:hypothetical protein n=1 Tax=Rhodocyclus purpureus TaxID=1067 RepID=UPI001912489F|nr:hypothetical protein [Rhodocyclus purpureus]MBK5915577.1 hypothetical protein [Rhodocyclus purpureus]